jgi:pimeloyl-ACP methyl ester carboxylesterase
VAFLRQHPGIRKVVLFGHSGGATLMTAYQLIAEGGVGACQGPGRLVKCPDTLAGLPAADGVVLADANWGNAEMALFSVDPAIVSNDSGMTVNADLDLWNPKNGFDPAGSHYSKEFIRTFQSAVARKENALIKLALDRLAAIDAGKGRFADDEPFLFDVYASTRLEELAPLGWSAEQQAAFLMQQFTAQHHYYHTNYAGADFQVILLDDRPVGRCRRAGEAAALTHAAAARAAFLRSEMTAASCGVRPAGGFPPASSWRARVPARKLSKISGCT